MAPAAYDIDDPRDFQHRQPHLPGEPPEAIPRKQRTLNLLLSILPLIQPPDGGKQLLDAERLKPIPDLLFVPRARTNRIPEWNDIGFRHSSALSLTDYEKNSSS